MDRFASSICLKVKRIIRPPLRLLVQKFHTDTLTIDDVPSPKKLPLIGKWVNLPLVLAGSMPKLHWYIDKRHKQLGPIFKDQIGPVNCVFVSDPEGIRSVFAQEGKYPIHILPEAWLTYNRIYNIKRGIFFMNGDEWLHFRKILNNLLLKGDTHWMEECCQVVTHNLIGKIRENSGDKFYYLKLEGDLYRSSLETILAVLLGPKRYLEMRELIEDSVKELTSTIHLVFETSSKLALVPSEFAAKWRISRWKKFESAISKVLASASKLVVILYELLGPDDDGLLVKMRSNMAVEDVTKIVTDLILAAGDTTVYSIEWMLYLLGRNRTVQERLRGELANEKGTHITSNVLLKNTIKECLRLYPVAPFLTRVLPTKSNVMGYDLPPNTVLIISVFSTGREENYFPNANEFHPDRWNNRNGRGTIVQNANLPFALGVRSCMGKRLAITQLQLTLAEIVKNFDFTIKNSKEIAVDLKMVLVPSEAIQLQFRSLD
ncbi:cytochrome P450 315a1, mitochondrial isoform X2 [Cylas formicarius]|nr:cytochrome P450 315a1, mitochondrial isoform X2 [Cylas formicarius]XP_060518799.1 cytochrome P450 315a1, mitochondrial isoform X2 [Cylas formicarius]